MRLGYTLPTLQPDPALPIDVARRAERTGGIDAVFAYEHLFRTGTSGTIYPALDAWSMLSAIAAATTTIGLGTLVARATLHPPAVLAHQFATLQRISDGRVIAAIGSGDAQSAPEQAMIGLPLGDEAFRVAALERAVEACRGGSYPVWVGGRSAAVRRLAATSDGWNRWGGSIDAFRAQVAEVRAAAGERDFTVSWGGIVCLGETEADARTKAAALGATDEHIVGSPEQVAEQLRAWGAAGADWVVLGAIDAANPDVVSLLGEAVAPLLGTAR